MCNKQNKENIINKKKPNNYDNLKESFLNSLRYESDMSYDERDEISSEFARQFENDPDFQD